MNSKISKVFDSNRLLRNQKKKNVALSNVSIYCTWENINKSCSNHKFKVSAPTWNEESELHDRSYSV